MKKNVSTYFSFLKNAFKSWWEKDPFRQSAVIAYYAIFSLPGLLVLIVAVSGYFFGRETVSDHLLQQVGNTLGRDTAVQMKDIIQKANDIGNSFVGVVIGVATILVGATTVFAQFQKSLNIIWEVKAEPDKAGLWEVVKVRLFSFGLIISIAFILLLSLVVSSVLSAMSSWMQRHWPDFLMILFNVVNFLISAAIISFLFALMFKFLPDAEIYWRDVWVGAGLTALLFMLGEIGLGIYFGKANPAEGYGPAGSVILILLWSSYSSMIVFFGAEFTKVYAEHHRKKIPASAHAKKEKAREF